MSNEEILKKAIEKAKSHEGALNDIKIDMEKYGCIYVSNYYWVIFSHDFAKHFWGEERTVGITNNCHICGTFYEPIAWQYHLQQMVLESEPLKYLEKFL